MATRYTYAFKQVDQAIEAIGNELELTNLLGMTNSSLSLLSQMSVPIPLGFALTSDACRDFFKQTPASFPPGMWEETLTALHELEDLTGRRFGDCESPLFVSCRSDPPVRMKGLSRCVLNLGFNDDTALATIGLTSNPAFVWNSYRLLIETFSIAALGVPAEVFRTAFTEHMTVHNRPDDRSITPEEWEELIKIYKKLVQVETGSPFPQDPFEQIRYSIAAIFRSYSGQEAHEYRKSNQIPESVGTGVGICAMIFGNLGEQSACGHMFTRNILTGEPTISGEFQMMAQQCKPHIRPNQPIEALKTTIPEAYQKLVGIAKEIEKRLKDMHIIGFSIEGGEVWVVKAQRAVRDPKVSLRVVVDFTLEGLFTKQEAVTRMPSAQIDALLFPSLSRTAKGDLWTVGEGVAPGVVSGPIALTLTKVLELRKSTPDVIFIQPSGKPGNEEGIRQARGIVIVSNGARSTAALLAQRLGIPAVVSCTNIQIDMDSLSVKVGEVELAEGAYITIDGSTGKLYAGKLAITPKSGDSDRLLTRVLEWAKEIRKMDVRACIESLQEVQVASEMGAEGLGLVRMDEFYRTSDHRSLVQQVFFGQDPEAIDKLGSQLALDVADIFRRLGDNPVTISLFDAPVQDFLPNYLQLIDEVTTIQTLKALEHPVNEKELTDKLALLEHVRTFAERNPLLGMRGTRSALTIPGMLKMQLKGIVEGVCISMDRNPRPTAEILLPFVCHVNEVIQVQSQLEALKAIVFAERKKSPVIHLGALIDTPRAALIAGELARYVDFLAIGADQLSQLTFAFSRDDAEASFIAAYRELGVFVDSPFKRLDIPGVGKLIEIAVADARAVNPDIRIGLIVEHGADFLTIQFAQDQGIAYIACVPYRIPATKLAAAQAVIQKRPT
jgi:pyruvate,orthophosphate dikinase